MIRHIKLFSPASMELKACTVHSSGSTLNCGWCKSDDNLAESVRVERKKRSASGGKIFNWIVLDSSVSDLGLGHLRGCRCGAPQTHGRLRNFAALFASGQRHHCVRAD